MDFYIIAGIILFFVIMALWHTLQLFVGIMNFLTTPFPSGYKWYEQFAGKGFIFLLVFFCIAVFVIVLIITYAMVLENEPFADILEKISINRIFQQPFSVEGIFSIAIIVAVVSGPICIVIKICFYDAIEEAREIINDLLSQNRHK